MGKEFYVFYDEMEISGVVAQLGEQGTENPRVGSSILPLGTIFCAGVAQSVEHITRNEGVGGSIPPSSSMYFSPPVRNTQQELTVANSYGN